MSSLRQQSLGTSVLTFEAIEAALDAGKLEMIRPWGDWVKVRRRAPTANANGGRIIHVWMENQVEASVSTESAKVGFPDVRIASQ